MVTNYIILLDAFLLVAMLVFTLRDARMRDLVAGLRLRRQPRPRRVPAPPAAPAETATSTPAPPPLHPSLGVSGPQGRDSVGPRGLDTGMVARAALRQAAPRLGGGRMVPVLVMVSLDERQPAGAAGPTPELPPTLTDPLLQLAVPSRADVLRSIGIDHLRRSLPTADANRAGADQSGGRPRRARGSTHLRLVHPNTPESPASDCDS